MREHTNEGTERVGVVMVVGLDGGLGEFGCGGCGVSRVYSVPLIVPHAPRLCRLTTRTRHDENPE